MPPRLNLLKDELENIDALPNEESTPELEQLEQTISSIGIILDHWYCTPEVLADVCSCARHWKAHAAIGVDSSNSIGTEIRDPTLRKRRIVYARLRRYAEAGCPNLPDIEEQLFIRHLPENLVDQTKFIRDQSFGQMPKQKIVQAALASRTLSLHLIKEQFIKSYAKWLVSLAVSAQSRRSECCSRSLTISAGSTTSSSGPSDLLRS